MKPFWVYMLRCADDSYCVGHTDDLAARIAQHSAGAILGHTRTRLPVELVFSAELPTRDDAMRRERQLKGWSRAKKEALARGCWDDLRTLARARRSTRSHRT